MNVDSKKYLIFAGALTDACDYLVGRHHGLDKCSLEAKRIIRLLSDLQTARVEILQDVRINDITGGDGEH